jgi:hypothetical protein
LALRCPKADVSGAGSSADEAGAVVGFPSAMSDTADAFRQVSPKPDQAQAEPLRTPVARAELFPRVFSEVDSTAARGRKQARTPRSARAARYCEFLVAPHRARRPRRGTPALCRAHRLGPISMLSLPIGSTLTAQPVRERSSVLLGCEYVGREKCNGYGSPLHDPWHCWTAREFNGVT